MKKLLTLIILPILFGCASDDELFTRTVKISSEPEGAIIVVNNFRMGPSPLSVEFEANENGHFLKKNTVTALPQSAELFTQIISFPAYTPANPNASKAPNEITFIMTKSPKEDGGVLTK